MMNADRVGIRARLAAALAGLEQDAAGLGLHPQSPELTQYEEAELAAAFRPVHAALRDALLAVREARLTVRRLARKRRAN